MRGSLSRRTPYCSAMCSAAAADRPTLLNNLLNVLVFLCEESFLCINIYLLILVVQLEDEEEPFVLEDTCVVNTDNMDAHSCDTSSLASSDSGDPAHLKRHAHTHRCKSVVVRTLVNVTVPCP